MQSPAKALRLPAADTGIVLHTEHVNSTRLIVRETSLWRWLLMEAAAGSVGDAVPIQSIMSRGSPSQLVLPYMQALCLPLCWRNLRASPNVLQIGLGGGAIDRFLLHYELVSQLVTVESEPVIAGICRSYFAVNDAVESAYRIETVPASVFLSRNGQIFDWIICDVHDGAGLPEDILNPAVHAALAEHLADDGVVCLNIADRRDPELAVVSNLLGQNFRHCWYAEVAGYENVLIFAARHQFQVDATRLAMLQSLLSIDIESLLASLIYVQRAEAR